MINPGASEQDWVALARNKIGTFQSDATDEPHPGIGDLSLNPKMTAYMPTTYRAASVMIALTIDEENQSTSLLLTQRSENLKDHPGQISFPGGKHEPEDADPWATAKRELMEEVGIAQSVPTFLGNLPPYHTRSGFRIWPYICKLPSGLALRPQASEVAEIFSVPFAFVMDPTNAVRQERDWQGRTVNYYTMDYTDPNGTQRRIWGITAGILVELRKSLLGT